MKFAAIPYATNVTAEGQSVAGRVGKLNIGTYKNSNFEEVLLMAELGQKKQRNYLVDFYKLIGSIWVFIAHFAQQFGYGNGAVTAYSGSAEALLNRQGADLFGAGGYLNSFYYVGGETLSELHIGGSYVLGVFTFLTGYWLIDWFKRQQKAGLVNKGQDCTLLFRYWAKNYASYAPYVMYGCMVSVVLLAVLYAMPIVNIIQLIATNFGSILGFLDLGFLGFVYPTPDSVMLCQPLTFIMALGEDFMPGYTYYDLFVVGWYMSTIICYAVLIMLMFFISEKVALFGVGPVLLYLFFQTNIQFSLTGLATNLNGTAGKCLWDFIRLFGPAYIGIYGWYLVRALKKVEMTKKVKTIFTVCSGISLAAFVFYTFWWREATLWQGDLIYGAALIWALLNRDPLTVAINNAFSKVSFISKRMGQVGLGFFLMHWQIFDIFRWNKAKHPESMEWFINMPLRGKFWTLIAINIACGIVFVAIDELVLKKYSKLIVKLTKCNEPVVLAEPEKVEAK